MSTKTEPKYGDTRPLPPCFACGGVQFEQFTSRSIYHNDSEDYWERVTHDKPAKCIKTLNERINRLESALGGKFRLD